MNCSNALHCRKISPKRLSDAEGKQKKSCWRRILAKKSQMYELDCLTGSVTIFSIWFWFRLKYFWWLVIVVSLLILTVSAIWRLNWFKGLEVLEDLFEKSRYFALDFPEYPVVVLCNSNQMRSVFSELSLHSDHYEL